MVDKKRNKEKEEVVIVDQYEDIPFNLHYPHYFGYSYIGSSVTLKYVEGKISKVSPINEDKELIDYIPQAVNPAITKLRCTVVENRLRTGDYKLICYDISTVGDIKIGLLESLRGFNNEKFCVGQIFGFITDTLVKPTVVVVNEWDEFEARIDGIWHFGEERFKYELKEKKLRDVEVKGLDVFLKYSPIKDMLIPHLKIAKEKVGGKWIEDIEVKTSDLLKDRVGKDCRLLIDYTGKILEVREKGEFPKLSCKCGYEVSKADVVGNNFKCGNVDCCQSYTSLMTIYMGATIDTSTFFRLLRLPNFKQDKIKDTWSISDQISLKDFEKFLRYLKKNVNLTKTQEKVVEINALRLYNLLKEDD